MNTVHITRISRISLNG